ncbi:hypothetical protein BJ165DRAFT_1535194 [Panaeolus papilionaceus]|nr:hypothetical protein BJ165DRAFT_1535194 [Panaeolus papilionaceus]
MEDLKLNRLRVVGHISVKPINRIPGDAVVYLIMGPTGAGKSTFIEALAGGSQNLAISSNQLSGFTQHVTAYKLVGVVRHAARAIYLVDTPGFSDSKISEIKVMEMLTDWLDKNWEEYLWSSALQVMDSAFWDYGHPFERITDSSTHLYCDLHQRMLGALQKREMLELNLAHSDARANKQLKDILDLDQKENNEILAKFISQLVKFGQPPHEFQEAAQALRKTIVVNLIPASHQMCNNFQQWAEDPKIFNELVSDPKLKDSILAMLSKESVTCEQQAVDHQPSQKLDFTETFRQLLTPIKIHRPKWLRRGE